MKKISVFLFFIFLGWAGVQAAHASVLGQEMDHGRPPYPYVLSQPINNLPQGFDTIGVGHETYYYSNGIFYQKIILEQDYIIVPPPVGAVVIAIPQGYDLMLINGMSFYEYQGIYYKRVLEGYRVVYPPR